MASLLQRLLLQTLSLLLWLLGLCLLSRACLRRWGVKRRAASTPGLRPPVGLHRVRRGGKRQAPREPTALQKKRIKNWSLHNARGRGLLLCNLRRASAKLRKHFGQQGYTHATMDELMEHVPIPSRLRDELDMVVFPGDPGATVTRSCAGLNWLGGEDLSSYLRLNSEPTQRP